MEHLEFQLQAKAPSQTASSGALLCGVVSSGNLEVLIEKHADPKTCRLTIDTAAEGFGEIWNAVLETFVSEHAVGGLAFSINDVGATPAVVSLRLRQALEEWVQGGQA